MYSDELLKRVKSFGALQYPIEKIITLIKVDDIDQFVADFKNPDSVLASMYLSGVNTGKYSLDASQFSIQQSLAEVQKLKTQQYKQYCELKKELFGIGNDV